MRTAVAIVVVLLATPVVAQQSVMEQALLQKLSQEIQAGLACNSTVIGMQGVLAQAKADLEKAKARIKELEDAKQ